MQENNIAQYKGIPGVWILLGREKSDTSLVCLQVGQTSVGIGDEIKTNISYLVNENFDSIEKNYINQFGEFMFSYEEHVDERRKMLYSEIAKKYDDLTFVCIAHGEELKNQGVLLKTIEKYVAFKTLSRYWVNGGPYIEKTPEEIDLIKKECANECIELFKTIKEKYPEKADSLNEFLNKLINGDIDNLIPRE